MGRKAENPRTRDRQKVYDYAGTAPLHSVVTFEAPVGAGKTLAGIKYGLRAAAEKGLRHVFVVLPYTSIIDQSVEVYREAPICRVTLY